MQSLGVWINSQNTYTLISYTKYTTDKKSFQKQQTDLSYLPITSLLRSFWKTQPKGLVLFCSKCRQEQGPAEVCRRCLLEKLLEWISEVTAWFWRQGVLPCQGQHFLSPRVTWRQPQAFPPCGWSICLWNWVPVSTVMYLCGYQCPPGGACKKTERLRGILCSTLEKETQVAGASGCVWFRDRTFCSSKWFATYFL